MGAGSYWSGVFFAAAGIVGGHYVAEAMDDAMNITVKVPDEQVAPLKQGKGDPAGLHREFGEQVDAFITEGGQGATVKITAGDNKTTIQHAPKAPIVLEPPTPGQ